MNLVLTRLCRYRRPYALLSSLTHLNASPQYQSDFSTSTVGFRRQKPKVSSPKAREYDLRAGAGLDPGGGLAAPYAASEGTTDEYLKKASLSPYVPTPDPVARKMLELAKAGSDDIHVELGSGDGRLNFHAIDSPYSVKKSVGIDIDENLIKMANDRLAKRHPAPNMQFIMGDLEKANTFEALKESTLITMYFVGDALKRIQPKLEEAIKGRDVRIVTCGYPMPNWDPKWVEVILGLTVYLYESKADQGVPYAPDMEQIEVAASHTHEEGEELRPVHNEEDQDVEVIQTPLFDPDEMIDGHWDVFDDDDEDDYDEDHNPILEKYRKMSLKISHKKKK